MAEIVMPRLSDSMEEGTIITWMKQVGDEIAVGDELVEIETDKANMAYEADVAGTLTEILAEEGDTLPIGSPIATIGDPGEGSGADGEGSDVATTGPVGAGDPPPPAVAKASSGVGPPTPPPVDETSETHDEGSGAPEDSDGEGSGRIKASPVAKRLAKEKGVDLSRIDGSGPGGRIVKKDVKRAAKAEGVAPPTPTQQEGVGGDAAGAAPPSPAPAASAQPKPESAETAKGEVTYEELSKLQQVVARRMSESKATAPHFYLQAEIDMSAAVEGRKRVKDLASEGDVVPSFNDMVVKACALALREHPRANGAYRDGRFELYSRVNVGVAVAGEDALVVPTVFDADRKGLREIATDTRALAGRVRDGKITPPELSGGTFTVSNLGMYGITNFSAVINSPQAAILAVGAIVERPVVRDGELTTAHLMGVTLACDHRILYGAPAAEFLARVRALLEEPLSLAL
ncbi:MAG TPA: dihydrolipoamide acetyltransferase family protein [Solirubrobacterales bacterium]|jgi:pyruvate dehydrogenase E2 component (dihydrolipoamide acetyltransferase)|nr:dihydrolipoamide acetyltransferase family protein [Solirubrobacterales bacterium]